MHRLLQIVIGCLLAGLFAVSAAAQPVPRWMTLPPTPGLPTPQASGLAPVNGISIWYASFGSGPPVILLHGGLANSNYWGNQVPALAESHRVIVMDSRGHGRSTRNAQPYGYALMASDVLGLMDFLGIRQAAIVGWSDGAILGLSLAMSHPERVSRLFAFAANSDPSGVKDVDKSFVDEISTMWATQPHWTAKDLNAIKVRTWIVDADHDEAIHRENTEFMAREIPDAGLLLQPEVSHFSMLQAPRQFTEDVRLFLDRKWD